DGSLSVGAGLDLHREGRVLGAGAFFVRPHDHAHVLLTDAVHLPLGEQVGDDEGGDVPRALPWGVGGDHSPRPVRVGAVGVPALRAVWLLHAVPPDSPGAHSTDPATGGAYRHTAAGGEGSAGSPTPPPGRRPRGRLSGSGARSSPGGPEAPERVKG